MKKIFWIFLTTLIFLIFSPKIVYATNLAAQTEGWHDQLSVFQVIQELGANLSGNFNSFTFRVSTSVSNSHQFDYTALNTRLYDYDIVPGGRVVASGCFAGYNGSYLYGLTFHTENVPTGYEDVTIDFSCNNFTFIPGHRYLIRISNANMGGAILFAAAAYGPGGSYITDFFTPGGLRYGNGNRWDIYYGGGACYIDEYLWGVNTQHPESGCNVWTSTADDLYFIVSDTPYQPPTPLTPPPTLKTPVIFIPGIGGSELKVKDTTIWSKDDGHGGTYTHTYPAEEKVWVNEEEGRALGNDDYFDILRLKSDGQTEEADLELTGNIYSGSYQGALDFLTANGYVLNKDLFVFPYDWRTDITLTAPLLDQKIESIKTQTGSQKIDIIAHSLGGLVARNYIANSTRASNVRKLITLGTPNLGAVRFLRTLQRGDCLIYGTESFCLSIAPSEIKDVIQNMISGYELAPSQKYYEFYDGSDNNHPVPFVDNRDIDNNGITGFLNYTQIKTLLTNLGYNTALFTSTEAFHNLDNNLGNLNGVDVSIIAGSGQATTGQIIEDYHLNFLGIKILKTDIRKVNGDDTVPLFSASLVDGSKSIAGLAKIYYTNQPHGNLVFDGAAMNLVKNILTGDASLPAYIDTTPYHFTGTGLSVHSPVLIHAYDQSGKHTGPLPNGDYEVNIPGSNYEVLGEAKFIWLPDDGIYTLKFEATDNGSFDFKIRDYENDINDKTILYKNVPLTISTKAETLFDTNSSTSPILQVDADGNGTTDSQVAATSTLTGNDSYDQTPPQTNIKLTGTVGQDNWYRSDVLVELFATDPASGSGILKTQYSLDNGATIQTYTAPFIISTEGINKLKVKSIDNAGNEEDPQEMEIKIDKTAPIVNLSATPQELWPINKQLIDVTIMGDVTDHISGVISKTFTVSDEYQQVQPVISDFNQMIKLEAWREGDDKDGRVYEIKVAVEDLAGNQTEATTQVLVPHDQEKE